MRLVRLERHPNGPRVALAGQRLHHGAAGVLVAALGARARSPLLCAAGACLAIHDRHDWRWWFAPGDPQTTTPLPPTYPAEVDCAHGPSPPHPDGAPRPQTYEGPAMTAGPSQVNPTRHHHVPGMKDGPRETRRLSAYRLRGGRYRPALADVHPTTTKGAAMSVTQSPGPGLAEGPRTRIYKCEVCQTPLAWGLRKIGYCSTGCHRIGTGAAASTPPHIAVHAVRLGTNAKTQKATKEAAAVHAAAQRAAELAASGLNVEQVADTLGVHLLECRLLLADYLIAEHPTPADEVFAMDAATRDPAHGVILDLPHLDRVCRRPGESGPLATATIAQRIRVEVSGNDPLQLTDKPLRDRERTAIEAGRRISSRPLALFVLEEIEGRRHSRAVGLGGPVPSFQSLILPLVEAGELADTTHFTRTLGLKPHSNSRKRHRGDGLIHTYAGGTTQTVRPSLAAAILAILGRNPTEVAGL